MASSRSSLNLRTGGTRWNYKVHPVVAFSILDHFKRRTDGQNRVIGTLLGEYDEKTNECFIKDCFPVPHIETADNVTVDDSYHQGMLALYRRVNPSEVVVGWYSTSDGDALTYISSVLHQVYKSQVEEPIFLTLDVNVAVTHQMGIKGYVGKEIKVGRKACVARFESVNVDVHAYEGEKIAVDALINGTPDSDKLDAPATILTDFENLEVALQKLHGMIGTVADYVKEVQDGTREGDPEIGMALSHAVAVLPHLSGETFDRMFAQNVQDLLMVLYLTNVTRTHLHLADKINFLLSDKYQ